MFFFLFYEIYSLFIKYIRIYQFNVKKIMDIYTYTIFCICWEYNGLVRGFVILAPSQILCEPYTGWPRSYRKSVLYFCVSVLGRLRYLQYIFAVTYGAPSRSDRSYGSLSWLAVPEPIISLNNIKHVDTIYIVHKYIIDMIN